MNTLFMQIAWKHIPGSMLQTQISDHLDSLEIADFIVEIEDKFNVDLPDHVFEANTVGDVLVILTEAIK